MDIITMKKTEISNYEIIKRLLRRELTEKEASSIIDRSVRQIRRMKEKVKIEGAKGLIHKRRGQKGNRGIPEKEEEQIKELLYKYYSDFQPGLACEKLREKHAIERDPKTIRRIMIEEKLWRPRKKKAKSHRKWRARKIHYGEMIQFDGSYHRWLEDREEKSCLLLAVDDATGAITEGEFAEHEGVTPVFGFWKNYIEKHGCPHSIYVDKFSTYKMNAAFGEDNHDLKTQFGRAMEEIGVGCIFAHSPQAKGRVERAFRTLQDRLVKEMRLEGISNRDDANKYLKGVFIPDFNVRFAVAAKSKTDLHKKLGKRDQKNLKNIFSRHYERVVQNDYTISFKKAWFQVENHESMVIYKKEKVLIEEHLDGEIRIRLRGRYLDYKLLPQRPIKAIRKPIKQKKINKPAIDHPWRNFTLYPKSKTHAK